MKNILFFIMSMTLISCNAQVQEIKVDTKPVIVYREKVSETITDVARDLLRFEKYDMALDLVSDDNSHEANSIRARVFEAKGRIHEAIELDITGLRVHDGQDFFEGSWILCDMYELCLKEIDYSISLLKSEVAARPSNYQTRLLLMKLYWSTGNNLEEVIIMADKLKKDLPVNAESFEYWRQDALDSLYVKDLAKYEEIMASYKEPKYNYVERYENE